MKLLHDVRLMFSANMIHSLKSPIFIFINMFQPLMYLILYMPLLGGLGSVPGFTDGNTANVFIPGLLVMQAIFGCAFVGFPLIDEIRSGVIQRYLVTPVSRSAIILGKVLRDVVVLLAQCILITLVALPFGLTLNPAGFALSLVLYVLIGAIMACLSYSFALIYKVKDALAPTLNTITLPVSLLSGIFLPLALAPLWLQYLAKINPFSYGVNATRDLFVGNFQSINIPLGFIIISIMSIIIFYWCLQSLKKMTT
ncbi:MAG: ABC transporter permease [Candidatus Bathyarchaeota archaeon]|nr:ABC transporter permease [Candidatus Termitimicrobium sp.]